MSREKSSLCMHGLRQSARQRARMLSSVADLSFVDPTRLQAVSESRGVDPYNTSGSFDSSRAWARVGKR